MCPGQGGLPKVVLKHSCGSKAEVWHSDQLDAFQQLPLEQGWPLLINAMHPAKLHMHLLERRCLQAQVYLYGACVVSWMQPSGDEVLYTRPGNHLE